LLSQSLQKIITYSVIVKIALEITLPIKNLFASNFSVDQGIYFQFGANLRNMCVVAKIALETINIPVIWKDYATVNSARADEAVEQ